MALRTTDVKETTFLEKRAPVTLISQLKKEHLVAGVAGGAVSAFILHPLDLIKIRFAVNEGVAVAGAGAAAQLNRPQYSGLLHALKTVFRDEGIRGLYRGGATNVLGASTAWGLYFFFYNAGKLWFQNGDTRLDLGPAMHMAIAANSGVLTLAVTNPIWVVKTRLCLQYGSYAPGNPCAFQPYATGIYDALRRVYKEHGIRGWYKGFVPGIFGVSHGALQFMAYEELKTGYNAHLGRRLDHRLTTMEYLSFAAASKVFASASTYPYQVVRSRLQDQHREYRGVSDVVAQTWRHEGVRGFYKGLLPNLLKVTPSTGLTFVVYESVISFLGA